MSATRRSMTKILGAPDELDRTIFCMGVKADTAEQPSFGSN